MRGMIKVAFGPGVVEEFTFAELGITCPGCEKSVQTSATEEAPTQGNEVPATAPVEKRPVQSGAGDRNQERRPRHGRKRPEKGGTEHRGAASGEKSR